MAEEKMRLETRIRDGQSLRIEHRVERRRNRITRELEPAFPHERQIMLGDVRLGYCSLRDNYPIVFVRTLTQSEQEAVRKFVEETLSVKVSKTAAPVPVGLAGETWGEEEDE